MEKESVPSFASSSALATEGIAAHDPSADVEGSLGDRLNEGERLSGTVSMIVDEEIDLPSSSSSSSSSSSTSVSDAEDEDETLSSKKGKGSKVSGLDGDGFGLEEEEFGLLESKEMKTKNEVLYEV